MINKIHLAKKIKNILSSVVILVIFSVIFSSCNDREQNLTNVEVGNLINHFSLESSKSAEGVQAIIKISSAYIATADDNNEPIFVESSYAWAYLTDGYYFIDRKIKCNDVLMKDFSSDGKGGQYQYASGCWVYRDSKYVYFEGCGYGHTPDYTFSISDYLGKENLIVTENNVPALKFVGIHNCDFVSKNGFTLNYSGYKPEDKIVLSIYAPYTENGITKELIATGGINFSQEEIKKFKQKQSNGVEFIDLGMKQYSSKIVEITDGEKILLIFETMATIKLGIK